MVIEDNLHPGELASLRREGNLCCDGAIDVLW